MPRQTVSLILVLFHISIALAFFQPTTLYHVSKSRDISRKSTCATFRVSSGKHFPEDFGKMDHTHRFVSLAMSASTAAIELGTDVKVNGNGILDSPFACPQCQTPFEITQTSCSNCGAPFTSRDGFVDLTPEATKILLSATAKKDPSAVAQVLTNLRENPIISSALALSGLQFAGAPIRQELFRTPLVAYLYERGWRQNFDTAGFPGIDKEFEMAMDFFQGEIDRPASLNCGLIRASQLISSLHCEGARAPD